MGRKDKKRAQGKRKIWKTREGNRTEKVRKTRKKSYGKRKKKRKKNEKKRKWGKSSQKTTTKE